MPSSDLQRGPAHRDLAAFAGRRALLFDLDGTLYSPLDYPRYFHEMDLVTGARVQELLAEPTAERAFERLLAEQRRHGFASKSATLAGLFGIGLAEMNRWREAHTHPEAHLRADPRLARLLEDLGSRFTLVLGTNNAPGLARRILTQLGVPLQRFAVIVTSEDAGAAKPEPLFFERVAAAAGLPCAAFASIGNSVGSDLDAAARLGMGTWLVEGPADLYRLAHARP